MALSLELLTSRVAKYFNMHAKQYGLRKDKVEARYILNWGGFVNASFKISDREKAYHLKLADDPEMQDRLLGWLDVADRLAERYRAPRVLEWIKVPQTKYEGLLMDFIHGEAADFAEQPEILRGLLELLPELHRDSKLRGALTPPDGPPSCTEYFFSVYIDRFDSDLMEIIPNLPPFVDLPLVDWMQGETRELEGLARDLPAFQRPANAPTHGDLGPNNVLVTDTGQWRIIDWDDLELGDPVFDYGIILCDLWYRGELSQEAMLTLLPEVPALRERFAVFQRAFVLDRVIDPLADWVAAEFSPEHVEEVRAEKERVHKEALAKYRILYPA